MRRQCQLDYTGNRVLKDTLRLKIYGHGSRYHETKINEGALKIITHEKKCDRALQRTLHQNR